MSTYSTVDLCAGLRAVLLGFLLRLLAAAGQLRLELGRGSVCVGCTKCQYLKFFGLVYSKQKVTE